MVKTDVNIRDSYKKYKELSDDPVDIKTYIKIANGYNKFLLAKVAEGYEVTLPGRMGTLSIVGTKKKVTYDENGNPNLAINWPATKRLRDRNPEAAEQKKAVYHTNEHSDGVRYKYLWSKKRIYVENKNLYALRLTRENKRMIPKMVSQGKEYYIKNK
jgi:hypothetical protein